MRIYCKICNTLLGEIQEGKIATKKLVCLCNKCYKYLSKDYQPNTIRDELEFISELMKVTGSLK